MRSGPYELAVLTVASESVSPDATDDLATGNKGQDRMERHAYQATFPNGTVQVDSPLIEAVEPGDDVQWLWPGRIPRGMVSLIEGDEGAGKSFVALDLVARVSRGREWPDGSPAVDPAVAENAPGAPQPQLPKSEVLKPQILMPEVLIIGRPDEVRSHSRRLAGMNADLSRFHWWRNFATFEPEQNRRGDRPVEFPWDLPALAHELRERESIEVVVIDSLADVCRRPQEVAETLRRLNQLAEEFDVAILVTLPARCRFDGQGALRVTSRWRTDGARCVWCVVADPDDPRRRLFVPRRLNFCEEPAGLEFRLSQGQVAWNAASRVDPYDPLGQWKSLERCLDRILQDGCVPAKDVFRQGSQCGFNPKQLRSGARRLGIESHKSAGFGNDGCWQWYTPAQRQLLLDRWREDQARQAEWNGGETHVPAAAATAGDQMPVDEFPADEFPGSHLPASIASSLTYDPATASRQPVMRTLNAKNEESLEKYEEICDPSGSELGRDDRPAESTVASSTANAKNEESLEKYAEIRDRTWTKTGREYRPAEPAAASSTPAWKRKRKTG